ncbi:MAG: phenylacetate--CoA ligase family protein, partial [Neofamilia sp.]
MKDNTFNKIKEKISSLKEIEGGYYKELFKDISMKEFNSLEDFEKLPFTDKDDLRNCYPLGI